VDPWKKALKKKESGKNKRRHRKSLKTLLIKKKVCRNQKRPGHGSCSVHSKKRAHKQRKGGKNWHRKTIENLRRGSSYGCSRHPAERIAAGGFERRRLFDSKGERRRGTMGESINGRRAKLTCGKCANPLDEGNVPE